MEDNTKYFSSSKMKKKFTHEHEDDKLKNI